MSCFLLFVLTGLALRASPESDPGIFPTSEEWAITDQRIDLVSEIHQGIDAYLEAERQRAETQRVHEWTRQAAGRRSEESGSWLDAKRARLAHLLGVVDTRVEPIQFCQTIRVDEKPVLAQGAGYTVRAIRWPVLSGMEGEGLMLEPVGEVHAEAVVLPDADVTPEQAVGLAPGLEQEAQVARHLAEHGVRVVVPVLIDRKDTWSGNPDVRFTNQPHREWITRGAWQMGRHVIGYEIQKVLAAVDVFAAEGDDATRRIGIVGDGEGGMIALHAAALDTRIASCWVSGYVRDRKVMGEKPIYRGIRSYARGFGDAEVAAMISPRGLVIEASRHPEVDGPPKARGGRTGAAPGRISTPPLEEVRREVARLRTYLPEDAQSSVSFVESPEGRGRSGSKEAMQRFLQSLGVDAARAAETALPVLQGSTPDADERMRRQVRQMGDHVEMLMRRSGRDRETWWSEGDAGSLEAWRKSVVPYREYLHDEIIGRLPPPSVPPNARIRPLAREATWQAYEIVLDVHPGLPAGGLLVLPAEVSMARRHPAVIFQHGLEDRPEMILADAGEDGFPVYQRIGMRLAEEGFVVFAPQNPYVGGDAFRQLQRKADPLGLSLYAFIACQQERILEWLGALNVVDADRIAYYGLSYGGKTALRLGALMPERYAAVICSGDFNMWTWKVISTDVPFSYRFTGEYEMGEFGMGPRFDHTELARMITPTPFLVERGHDDGVSVDAWVAAAFAPVRRHASKLGIGDRAGIAWFDGPHRIDGRDAMAFLKTHLKSAVASE